MLWVALTCFEAEQALSFGTLQMADLFAGSRGHQPLLPIRLHEANLSLVVLGLMCCKAMLGMLRGFATRRDCRL